MYMIISCIWLSFRKSILQSHEDVSYISNQSQLIDITYMLSACPNNFLNSIWLYNCTNTFGYITMITEAKRTFVDVVHRGYIDVRYVLLWYLYLRLIYDNTLEGYTRYQETVDLWGWGWGVGGGGGGLEGAYLFWSLVREVQLDLTQVIHPMSGRKEHSTENKTH